MGWQGVTLQTPAEWNLVAYGGDPKMGTLRIDNSNEPGQGALGIELRWSQVKGKITDADLEKRLDQYFVGITKSAKRQKIITETKSKTLLEPKRPERDAIRSFQWRADRKGIGRIWHCKECGRLTIAQVVGGPRDEFASMAGDVLASMECHSPEIGWRTWSLYDLSTEVPTDFALKGQPQLMNIYVQLAFQRGQSQDTLTIEQWGVANVQLRGAYLDEWFRSKNAKLEPMLRYDASEAEAQDHPALALVGRRTGVNYWASQGISQVGKLQMPATHYAARIWECPETNKIYLVQSFTRRAEPDLLEQVVARTRCHESDITLQ